MACQIARHGAVDYHVPWPTSSQRSGWARLSLKLANDGRSGRTLAAFVMDGRKMLHRLSQTTSSLLQKTQTPKSPTKRSRRIRLDVG